MLAANIHVYLIMMDPIYKFLNPLSPFPAGAFPNKDSQILSRNLNLTVIDQPGLTQEFYALCIDNGMTRNHSIP